ncbi:hypothetical protein [Yoonia sp. BS5-3]|uniref:Uncharacterized protein n=1 Tax=Yoonia phaeophyticola TaxID=3137369 RepID=A0ABZ2V446_9RHOB
MRGIAADRQLVGLFTQSLVSILDGLLQEPIETLPGLNIPRGINEELVRLDKAANHVHRTAMAVEKPNNETPFIYEKLIARQQRWYAHAHYHPSTSKSSTPKVMKHANPYQTGQLVRSR